MKEYEHHVNKDGKRGGVSYCGKKLDWSEYYLIDAEHAIGCVNQETRIQPCQQCYKKIKDER